MSLGDQIEFDGGSYEVRSEIDGRYVVGIRNRVKNTQKYVVWTDEKRADFDQKSRNRIDNLERNAQIFERNLAGETYVA